MALRKLILAGMMASVMSLGGLRIPAHAAGEAAGGVDVESDQMEIIDAEHKTIFSGNVVAKRPTDTIKADKMVVTSADEQQTDGTTKQVTKFVDATGNVSIVTKSANITGDWAKFDVANNQMVVGGNVKMTQNGSTVIGQHLEINTKTNHLQMTGGRVSGSFVP